MQETTRPISGPDRQGLIVDLIHRQQRATITELCEVFGVSKATIRRDLETLDGQGLVRRFHGGAIQIRKPPPEKPILYRSSEDLDEKRSIGRAAAQLVNDGETSFLGSGSTVLELARNLRVFKSLTVLTNSAKLSEPGGAQQRCHCQLVQCRARYCHRSLCSGGGLDSDLGFSLPPPG